MRSRYKYFYLFILTAVIMQFVGCSDDHSVGPAETPMSVNFEGVVSKSTGYDDLLEQGYEVKNAVVDIYRIGSNGVEEKVSRNSVTTDYNGKYVISAQISGDSNYLVKAREGNREYKVVVFPAIESDLRVYIQPANLTSTAQSEVYLNALKKNYNFSFYDISLLVNPEISELIIKDPGMTEIITEIIAQSVKIRSYAYLSTYFNGTISGLERYSEFTEDLSAKFARDLHFATSNGTIENIIESYYESIIDAFINSGLNEDKISKLQEIYYRMLISLDSQNEELRVRFLRSSALKKASVLNQIVISDFQKVKGNKSIEDLKDASKELKKALKAADGYGKIRSSFNNYNKKVMMNLFKAVGINGNLKKDIDQKMMTYMNVLSADLSSATRPEAVSEAFIKYFVNTSKDVNDLLKDVYDTDSKVLADLLVLLYIDI